MDGHVGENLAVDFDASLVEAVDEAAVGQAGFADGSVDTLDPQSAEVALVDARSRYAYCIGTIDRSLGDADGVLAAAVEALGCFRSFLCLAWEVTPLFTRAMS
jgi:hypothetical protein